MQKIGVRAIRPGHFQVATLGKREYMIPFLYGDDNELLREGTRMHLKTQVFPINTTQSEAETLEKSSVISSDEVVSDFEMSGMNKVALLKKDRIRYPELPFIFFTGRGQKKEVIESQTCGADYSAGETR